MLCVCECAIKCARELQEEGPPPPPHSPYLSNDTDAESNIPPAIKKSSLKQKIEKKEFFIEIFSSKKTLHFFVIKIFV